MKPDPRRAQVLLTLGAGNNHYKCMGTCQGVRTFNIQCSGRICLEESNGRPREGVLTRQKPTKPDPHQAHVSLTLRAGSDHYECVGTCQKGVRTFNIEFSGGIFLSREGN